MDPITLGLLLGAGTGLLKNQLIDVPQAQKNIKLQAEIAKMSPWSSTKEDPNAVSSAMASANPFSAMLQFGSTGALMGQGIDQSNNMKGLNNAISGNPDPNAFANESLDPSHSAEMADANPYGAQQQQIMQGGGADAGTAGTTNPLKVAQMMNSGWVPPPMPAQYMPGNNYNLTPWS